jgi:hypothetical protein
MKKILVKKPNIIVKRKTIKFTPKAKAKKAKYVA